jgi:2,4-dienoyl-CoA reductase-like NADH-dependent reductase (Old Yellow Enzyme family)
MERLFNEISFGKITSRNRIMVSPMCQYSSEGGFATNWHLVHLGSRAVGGAGIVMTEAAAVSPEGRISYADLGVWKDEHVSKLKEITAFISQNGAVPAIQLAHAGRKASKNKPWEGNNSLSPDSENGWQTVAPSSIPFNEDDPTPHELTKGEIKQVIEDFKKATLRSVEAGFQLIELHAAHGYLVHEFLSPISNKREDEYGGSFENRIRFLLELTKEVKSILPDGFPLFVRISATDWVDDAESWTLDESIKLSKKLSALGVDLIDVSSGGLTPDQKIEGGAGYQTEFASRIKKEAQIRTGAVGLITTASQAEHILRSGQADLVIMAREFLRTPYFPLQAAKELKADIEWPDQYKRAKL